MQWLSFLLIRCEASEQERGQGLAEYAMILALIAVVVVVGLTLYGNAVEQLWRFAVDELLIAFSGNATP